MLKMGGYGFLRPAIPLFPQAAMRFAPWIGLLAVIGIVYGALVSLVQPDMKKLVAYSSVSHLGFVMLGIASFTPMALVGSVYQMLNHGISTGALFFLVGMLYDRRHTRAIAEFGGIKNVRPWFAAVNRLVHLRPVAPALIVATTGLVVLLAQAFPPKDRRSPSAPLSLFGLVMALLAAVVIASSPARGRGSFMGGSLAADDFALFF